MINLLRSSTALIILIFLFPLIILISIVIFIEDGLPFIFKQDRLGKDKKLFTIYKFRTMKKMTPELETKKINPKKFLLISGSFLRKLSLDEVLNLINVIKMEMNFIGYRPSLKNQISLNEKRLKHGIYSQKPGITGLAQINGRDNITDNQKFFYEKQYLTSQSIFLDLKIIVITFLKTFNYKNISH